MNEKLTDRAKSRKFIAFAFVMIVASVCLLVGWADFDQWSDIVKWDMGFYFTGNIASHLTNKIGGIPDPPVMTDER